MLPLLGSMCMLLVSPVKISPRIPFPDSPFILSDGIIFLKEKKYSTHATKIIFSK